MEQKKSLIKASKIVGSQTKLAKYLGISKSNISQWLKEGNQVPAEHCPTIERLTKRQVRCEDLRPSVDWAYVRKYSEDSAND